MKEKNKMLEEKILESAEEYKKQMGKSTNAVQEKYEQTTQKFDESIDKVNFELSLVKIESRKISKIGDNLLNFFGLTIGILALILINYQFLSNAKDLGVGKMLILMGMGNIGLIFGILVIFGVLSDLLGKEDKFKASFKILDSKIFLLGIALIIGFGFWFDVKYDGSKESDVKKNIQEVQATQKKQYEELYNELNKKDVENGKLKNEIDSLRNEIENLKNKK